MPEYCITSARPKNATQHLKSEFKLWQKERQADGKWLWVPQDWKTGAHIAALLAAGNSVVTARYASNTITIGAAVEMELRIAKNETNFKISDMPDT